GAQSSPPRVDGSKIAGSYLGAVPLCVSAGSALIGRRDIHTDELGPYIRVDYQPRTARIIDDGVDDREPRRIAFRHDVRLLDAIEIIRHEAQAGSLLRDRVQPHA